MKKYLLILGLMLAPLSAIAATCSTTSTYKSGTNYTATNCGTYNAQVNFTAGGYVKSCATCSTGYTRFSKTITHSSGCTYTMYDCASNGDYAYVVTTCATATNNTTYKDHCNNYGTNVSLGQTSTDIMREAGLSGSVYETCGVYNIRNAGKETPEKVILCFKKYIYINGQTISGTTMADNLAGCADDHHGEDGTTVYYRDTDWSGANGESIAISNYALWSCCNSTSCTGYAEPRTYSQSGEGVIYYLPYKCADTGTCTTTTNGCYLRCNANYYSSKGVSKKTHTGTGAPYNSSSSLGCTLCSTATGKDAAISPIGSTAITQCYLPSGYSETDTTGTWKFTSNCNYSN